MTMFEIVAMIVVLAVTCIGGLVGHIWGPNVAIGAIFTPTTLYAGMLAIGKVIGRRAEAKRLPRARAGRRAF